MKTSEKHQVIARFIRRSLVPVGLFVAALCLASPCRSQPGLGSAPSPALKPADAPVASSQAVSFASLPSAAQSAISAAIGRDQSDYRAQPASNGSFRTLNSGGQLAAEFAQGGVVVRAGAPGGAGWGLAFEGYGRGKWMDLVPSATPQANANRVEYRRGDLTEWYVNGPLGLEQGFTLARPPARAEGHADEPLTIALALSGDLIAALDSADTGLALKQRDGRAVMSYTGLTAQDAAGMLLRCWLELHGSQLLLRINDAGARYPIIVDPWMQAAELTNSSGVVSDDLGHSVAVSGNTVVVGALGVNKFQGAVYVFVEPATGWATTSAPTAVLTVPVAPAIQQVGYSVAISRDGSTIVTGAPSATIATPSGSNQYEGAAYVFARPTNGWANTSTPTAELNASDGVASQNFGYSVGVNESGNTVVIGSVGPAYVFNEPTMAGVTSWSEASSPQNQTAELTNSGAGFSLVAISGNTVVGMGSFGTDADVFVGPTFPSPWAATSTPSAVLTPSNGMLSGPVAISGGTVVVGGVIVNPAGSTLSVGAVYVFVAPGGVWTSENESAVLTPSPTNSICYDFFGASVGINETADTIVVGAYGAGVLYNSNCMIPPTPPTSQQGAAYVFAELTRNGVTAWTNENETQKLTASDAANGDLLGYSVGISGNTVVAGAPSKTIGSNPFQGAAYVFTQPAVAALYSNPGPINFGAVQVNTAGTYSLTLTNPSTNSSSFMVNGVSLQGSDAAYFSITNVVCNGNTIAPANYSSFSVTLNPNGSDACTFTLQFLPTLDQNGYSDLLVVATTATTSNAQAGPGGTGQAFLLVGDGIEPYASYSPLQLNFGNVTPNTPATQTVTVTDTGDGPLVLQLAKISPLGTGFSYTQVACNAVVEPSPVPFPLTISPGNSCTFTVQFDPSTSASASGGLGFADNAGVGESNLTSTSINGTSFQQNVPLSGNNVPSIATTTTITSTNSSYMGLALPAGYALVGNPLSVNFSVQPVSGTLIPTGTVIVEDGLHEYCNPVGTLTSANKGIGSCTLTFNEVGTGSTPLSAQYTPDTASSSAGLLGSATVQPLFTENLVQIANCGTPPSVQSATQGMTTTFTFTVCLAGDVNAAVTALVSGGCPQGATCGATVTAVQGQAGVYKVVVTITTGSGGTVPPQDFRPFSGPTPLMFFAFGLLVAVLLGFHFAPRKRARLRLAYGAGLAIALALMVGNLTGCGSSSTGTTGTTGTPVGTYTINVNISAGAFSVTVPLTLTVTK